MSNKIFHFSNTGISSGQRFYLKDDVSGIFLRNLNIDSNFPVVGSNLIYNTGDQTISGIKTFASRPTVNGTGFLLSGEASAVTLPNTIVYTTGDQIISGNKTFVNNIAISGTGIFNALDLNNIDTLNLSGVDISLTNGNVSLTNRPTVNGTGVVLSGELNPIIVNTGSLLNNKINLLSGYVNSQDIIFSGQTFNTGSLLNNKIDSLSGYVNSQDIVFSGQTASTGSNLDRKINILSGYINSNSSNILFTTGNQTISGNKNFAQNVTVGDETQDNLLIVSGNAISFGVYPTINGTGIVYTQGNQTISGIKTFNVLPIVSGNTLITGVDLSSYLTSSSASSTYSTITNLASTGSTLVNIINSLSGTLTGNYVTKSNGQFTNRPTVNGTGVLLIGEASSAISISGNNFVYTTGNQLISGNKTFLNNIAVSGTGNFNNVRVSNVDSLNLSGIEININTGNIILTNSLLNLNNSKLINAVPDIINISNNFNISGNYNSRMILANSPSEITGRLISGNPLGFNTSVIQIGIGRITITGSGIGISINSYNNQYKTAGQFASISLLNTGNNGYIMYGNTAL